MRVEGQNPSTFSTSSGRKRRILQTQNKRCNIEPGYCPAPAPLRAASAVTRISWPLQSAERAQAIHANTACHLPHLGRSEHDPYLDRKSTRLNSSHGYISYAVFCLKKKNKTHY